MVWVWVGEETEPGAGWLPSWGQEQKNQPLVSPGAGNSAAFSRGANSLYSFPSPFSLFAARPFLPVASSCYTVAHASVNEPFTPLENK